MPVCAGRYDNQTAELAACCVGCDEADEVSKYVEKVKVACCCCFAAALTSHFDDRFHCGGSKCRRRSRCFRTRCLSGCRRFRGLFPRDPPRNQVRPFTFGSRACALAPFDFQKLNASFLCLER